MLPALIKHDRIERQIVLGRNGPADGLEDRAEARPACAVRSPARSTSCSRPSALDREGRRRSPRRSRGWLCWTVSSMSCG